MKFIVCAASDFDNFEICKFKDLSDLLNLQETIHHSIILQDNVLFGKSIDLILRRFPDLAEDEANEIRNIKKEILIYDDYIE